MNRLNQAAAVARRAVAWLLPRRAPRLGRGDLG